jgi:hypothetical protein
MHARELIEVQERGQLAGVDRIVLAAVAEEPGNAAGIGDLYLGGQRPDDLSDPLRLQADLVGHLALTGQRPQRRLQAFPRRRRGHQPMLAPRLGCWIEDVQHGKILVHIHSYIKHGVSPFV